MRMGIKEFRERLSEVTRSGEAVQVTHHGRIVGTFTPSRRDPAKLRQVDEAIGRWQAEMKATGVDLESKLAAVGLDPWGERRDEEPGEA